MKPLAVIICLCNWLGIACQASSMARTAVHPPTSTPTSLGIRTPTPISGPLTHLQATVLIREKALARGVSSDGLSVRIAGEPRWVSIRYSSSYAVGGRAFRPQMMLIALAAARTVARVQPPADGGMRLAVMPGGEGNVGLALILIKGSTLEAWANDAMSDQEFISQWTEGIVTKE